MTRKRRILFYRSSNGVCPFGLFLDSLAGKEAKRIAWLLELLREIERMPESYFKKLRGSDALWEGRIRACSESYRVIGFFDEGTTIVLTNGFRKGSRKTPRNEIETAERRKRDHYERKAKNG